MPGRLLCDPPIGDEPHQPPALGVGDDQEQAEQPGLGSEFAVVHRGVGLEAEMPATGPAVGLRTTRLHDAHRT